MRITIAERLRPFSHLPGTVCSLPGTPYEFCFYPTRVGSLDLPLHGPVADFTVQQDLEKCRLTAWGHYKEGFFRYHIFFDAEEKAVVLDSEKGRIRFIENCTPTPRSNSRARLSLGCHKAQDWDLVKRRGRLEEIFPFWFRLGMLLNEDIQETGHPLLEECAKNVLKRDKCAVYASFKNLFLAGFQGILAPRLQDEMLQGLMPSWTPSKTLSATALLSTGAHWISRLFVEVHSDGLSFLPVLPPEFHCGRITDFSTPFGEIDLEWSKKTMRRLIFRSCKTAQCSFIFPKSIKGFRLRTNTKDKGVIVPAGVALDFQENGVYFFDNFTH